MLRSFRFGKTQHQSSRVQLFLALLRFDDDDKETEISASAKEKDIEMDKRVKPEATGRQSLLAFAGDEADSLLKRSAYRSIESEKGENVVKGRFFLVVGGLL